MAPGTELSIGEVVKEGGLYKIPITIKIQGQDKKIDSYISEDGTKFFPEMMEIKDDAGANDKAAANSAAEEAQQDIPKSDKPEVDLFVMTHCPFGTQIEKGIIPVFELLGDKTATKSFFPIFLKGATSASRASFSFITPKASGPIEIPQRFI